MAILWPKSGKRLGKRREKLLVLSNFIFCHYVKGLSLSPLTIYLQQRSLTLSYHSYRNAFPCLCSRRLFENIVTKEEIAQNVQFLLLPQCFPLFFYKWWFGYWIELKSLWQVEKLFIMSNFSVCHIAFKSYLLQRIQKASLCAGKGLTIIRLISV